MNFQAVLFDCDGVLVESEAITNDAPNALRAAGASVIFTDMWVLADLV